MLKKDPVLKEKIVAFINSFYREERRSPSFQEIGSYFNINKTTSYRYILEMKNEGMVGYDGKSITTSVTSLCNSPARNNAPICGEIGCGDPTSELENIEEYVNLPESIFGTGELYIFRAYGDSMVDSGIEPGVLVVIDKNAKLKVDDIVVVSKTSDLTSGFLPKKVRKKEKTVLQNGLKNAAEPTERLITP